MTEKIQDVIMTDVMQRTLPGTMRMFNKGGNIHEYGHQLALNDKYKNNCFVIGKKIDFHDRVITNADYTVYPYNKKTGAYDSKFDKSKCNHAFFKDIKYIS